MKHLLLISAFILSLAVVSSFADDKGKGDELQRKSRIAEPPTFGPVPTTFPMPFDAIIQQNENNQRVPAVSTGYFLVDSDERLPEFWRPNPERADPYNDQPQLWRRIVPGPGLLPPQFWSDPSNSDGLYFFRNPQSFKKTPSGLGWQTQDSTDDAIAGPIPIGISGGFYFNGLRYDSFYVSTNGVIALTNRRYFYDKDGNRVIPEGADHAYDPNYMGWFVGDPEEQTDLWHRAVQRDPVTNEPIIDPQTGSYIKTNGLSDPVNDNFGYYVSVLGTDPYFDPENPDMDNASGGEADSLGGIRARPGFTQAPYNFPADLSRIIPGNRKSALIAFAWGDMHLSQYNNDDTEPEDFGQAWFKRSVDGTTLKIAVFNLVPKGGAAEGSMPDVPFGTISVPENNRPGPGNYFIAADINVILDRKDSSITINYSSVQGVTPAGSDAPDAFRRNSIAGVKGYARHTNFGQPGGEIQPGHYNYPWADEYMQYTHYFANYAFQPYEYPFALSAVKFRQWQNTVRVAGIEYLVRDSDPNSNTGLDFIVPIKAADVIDYELLAGEPLIGALQPVALIQNLTNEIQGENGVNFVRQDLEFRTRFRVQNQITGRIIYNRIVPVTDDCLELNGNLVNDGSGNLVEDWYLCTGDPTVRVRLATSVKPNKTGVEANALFTGDEFAQTGFTGVPPYYYVQIRFPAFEPNEFIDNHIGRHRSYIIADPSDPVSGEYQGDEWPFDDSSSTTLFVMRRLEDFHDDVTQWHVDLNIGSNLGPINIPSALKWVNIHAEAVSSDNTSLAPLAPRGRYFAHNPEDPDQPFINANLSSPAIKMNRLTHAGGEPDPDKYVDDRGKGGDMIMSFPIDMRYKYDASISFALQRTDMQSVNDGNVVRGWSDENSLVGPEPRVIRNGDIFRLHTAPASGADEIALEIMKPSDDGINGITNVPHENWRHHPGRRGSGADLIENMAALTVYGAGGFLRGFLQNDPDSALTEPMNDLTQQERLDGRTDYGYNEFDDGIDFSFKKYFVAIPDTFINWKSEGAKNFRFRLRVLATAHNYDPAFLDDADDFFVDNIQIITNPEAPDLEVLSVKADQPYAMLPPSQATDIPITVQVSNNANIDASTFSVKVKIFRLIDPDQGVVEDEPIYCRTVSVSNLTSLRELNIGMPSWNARKSQREGELTAHYRMMAIVNLPEVDYEPLNDTNYTDISLTLSTVFAYDGVSSYDDPYLGELFEGQTPVNSVSAMVAPGAGRGLTLFGSNYGGSNAQPQINFTTDRAGVPTGNGSGEIAMKFTLNNPDTVRGYQAYFGSLNASPEWILFRLISDNGSTPGNATIEGSQIVAQRMRRYVNGEIEPNILPNQYVTYILDNPLPLDPGAYWLAIAQLNQTGLELGGSANRMGMRTLNFFINPNNGIWGESGNVLLLDKQFRTEINNNLFNQNYFAYADGLGSDEWVQFTPSVGNPAFAQWNHNGDIPPGRGPQQNTVPSLSNGSWIPMLRPWFGPKTQGSAATVFEWCPDDIPVEMINFTGEVRKGSIDLNWETASEENNYGFEVERRINGEDEAAWNKIGFVSGHGNSNNLIRYNYSDKDVALNQTYDYRLKQMDFDGTESCATSNIVTLTYESIGELVLNQNSPNPFFGTSSTSFSFNLPQNEVVTVEILDMYGNVVKTLIDGQPMSASEHHCQWDGIGQDGNPVSSGTYIYRLKAGNETRTQKMSVIK